MDEEVLGRWPASHVRGAWGTKAGGMLQLTRGRLTFTPHRVNRWVGRASWECVMSDEVHIGVVPRGVMPWPARLERPFGIVHGGILDLFEVGNVDAVVGAIRASFGER